MVSAHVDYSDDGRFGSNFGEETERVVVNAPLTNTAAVRLAISDDRIKGVQVNNFNGTPDVSTEWGGRVHFLFLPTDEFEANIIADYDRRGQNYNDPQFTYVSANPVLSGQLAACGITPSYSNQARCWSNANDLNYRNYGASAQFDYHLSGATLTSITGYRKQITAPSDFDAIGLSCRGHSADLQRRPEPHPAASFRRSCASPRAARKRSTMLPVFSTPAIQRKRPYNVRAGQRLLQSGISPFPGVGLCPLAGARRHRRPRPINPRPRSAK